MTSATAMPIAMIEAFIGQPAKHNCLVLIITRLRQNKNDVICPVADDDMAVQNEQPRPHRRASRRIAANIAKLPAVIASAVTREADEDLVG
jgi:hypothetical protein